MIWLMLSGVLASGLIYLASGLFRRETLLSRVTYPASYVPFWQVERERLKFWLGSKFEGSSRKQRALRELPEILDMMAVALSAGDSLFAALARVSSRAAGVLASEFQRVFIALELGGDLETELLEMSHRLPQRQVSEFTSKLILSLKRGNPLAEMIREQAASARSEIRNELLKQAGRNETRMLIPLVFLILPITVLFAIYPSLQLLNINYT
jgi:tight adherence protein C